MPVAGVDAEAFRGLVSDVVAIAGQNGGSGNPLPDEGPRPMLSFGGVGAEVRALAPKGKRFGVRLKVLFEIALSTLLHRTGWSVGGFDARDYGRQLVRNTDFRKFDDGLKMTVDLGDVDIRQIEDRLERATADGICTFGMHRQTSALVTCIVPSAMSRDHMHFIDGGSGGYAKAASVMKAKQQQAGSGAV